jgi:DNA-directed RNA polymerase alpha subunit
MIPIIGRGHIDFIRNDEDRTWKNTVKFDLEIEGENAYSNNLQIQDDAKDISVYPDIIIVSMKSTQKIKLTAEGTLNYGYVHCRWNSAVAVSCYPRQTINLKNKKDLSAIRKACKNCIDEHGNIINTDKIICVSCKPFVSEKTKLNKHYFSFESTGSVDRKIMLKDAVHSICKNVVSLRHEMTKALEFA